MAEERYLIDKYDLIWHTEEKKPYLLDDFKFLYNFGYDDMHILAGDYIRHFKRETVNPKYAHFISDYLYIYRGAIKHIDTGALFALYTSMYEKGDAAIGKNFIRPYEMFISDVDTKKYPNICQIKRFELATESEKKLIDIIRKEHGVV